MAQTVQIEVSEETLAAMRRNADEYTGKIRLAAAAKLSELGRVSQEIAAEIAGMNRLEFLMALSRFGVTPFQDTRESLERELDLG